ncbi:MAG: hypothetical protein OFPI_35960 [Osedax symbiont Rs2]|nr:MAG: hypothetical protein OFPI_35960 [Osedax symbiont Rs2]
MQKVKFFSNNAKLLSLGSILLLSGCASMNQSECISADWSKVGYENALSGKKGSYVAKHTEACAEYAITPQFAEYQRGWNQGINKFCTAQFAWKYASDGRYYHDTCSAESEAVFLPAYKLGKELRLKQREIERLNSDLEKLFDELVADKVTKEKRLAIASERKNLQLEIQLQELKLSILKSDAKAKGFID